MHTEKQDIFDKYAKSKGYISWVSLIIHHNNRSLDYDDHVFAACDLVQQKALKKASNKLCEVFIDDEGIIVCDANKYCNSITNPENLIR